MKGGRILETTVFISQKYFIFKLADILNNSFHIFEEKRMESLQLVIGLCLDTYEEMHNTPIGTNKLEKSYSSLLENLAFHLNKHPFRKLQIYKTDFERLCRLIKNKDKEKDTVKNPYELYMGMKSLQRKLRIQNLSAQYIESMEASLSFQEIDILIESFVSDLLYVGYSLNYLNKWYSELKDDAFFECMEKGDISLYIEKFKELNGEKKEYEVIIPYTVKSESQKEIANRLLTKHFIIKSREDYKKFSSDWNWKEETYACKMYIAADYYKAIEIAKKEFLTDKELFSMWQNVTDVIRENVTIGCVFQEKLLRMDIRKVDNTKLINYFDRNRTEQLNIFINLKDGMKNEDVDTLERILHMLHTAKTYNIQNRFLNFWSALEYSIYPFPKKSIIEKARTIVSESFTLFYVKNKMNIFWERLNYTMSKKGSDKQYPKCKKLLEYCRDGEDFNTQKLISFLQDSSRYEGVLNEIAFNIVLEREIRELIMLVSEPKKLKKAITEYHNSIIHDLDCIYRLRNQLIHSAKAKDDSLEHISLRLYRYVNSIISTILYYKKGNAEVSIIEILNSLHNTYEVYQEELERYKDKKLTSAEGYKIVRPKYLFLE